MNIYNSAINRINQLQLHIILIVVSLLLILVACSPPPPTKQKILDNIEGKWLFDGVLKMKIGHNKEGEDTGVIEILEFQQNRISSGYWIDSIQKGDLTAIKSYRTGKECVNVSGVQETNYSISENSIHCFPEGYFVGHMEITKINNHILIAEIDGGKARKFVNQKYYDTLSQNEKKAIWASKEDI